MLNIIVVNDYAFINGGCAKVAITSALALCERGFHVAFFAAVGPVCEELRSSGIRIRCLNQDDINTGSRGRSVCIGIWNPVARRELAGFLEELKPQKGQTIIHVHGWSKALSSSIFSAIQKSRLPAVVTLHDYFTLCPNGGFYDFRKGELCYRKPMSLSCLRCNCDKRSYQQKLWRCLRQAVQDRMVRHNQNLSFISISALNEKLLRDGLSSERFYRVENSGDIKSPDAAKRVPTTAESFDFIYVGRISEEKGCELFCRAVTSAMEEDPRVCGRVLGSGQLMDELKGRYPAVYFEGWKNSPEVAACMETSRALVLPSKWYEAAPLSVIEALSCGLPCIVSDCTSAVELIHDGENGFVFHSDDADDLKASILRAMDDAVIERMKSTIQLTFDRDTYTLQHHTDSLIKVYEDMLRSSHS